MTQDDDIDDARAALIDQRIGQAFDFLGDVIDDPRLLDAIPDGSRLTFRDVELGGIPFRLTAYQPPGARDQWSAIVTRHPSTISQDEVDSAYTPRANGTTRTATLALDALETELRVLLTIPA